MMKRIYTIGYVALMLITFAFLYTGCKRLSAYDYSPYVYFNLVEEAYLNSDENSPYCDFSMDYSCLNEENDTIAALINEVIHREFLGAEFASLAPAEAVDSFKNTYLRNYRTETGELYEADKAKMTEGAEVPAWYGQTYSIVTFMEEGRDGIMGASANYFVDLGGAHPSQWSKWLNFDTNTGQLLTVNDVFELQELENIEDLLHDAVLKQKVDLYPDTKAFLTENFMLAKEGVRFLYNRYDIAPRSSGSIMVEIPYEVIEPYLKK